MSTPYTCWTKKKIVANMMNFISYCDGTNSILEISNICNIDFDESFKYYVNMKDNGLIDWHLKSFQWNPNLTHFSAVNGSCWVER